MAAKPTFSDANPPKNTQRFKLIRMALLLVKIRKAQKKPKRGGSGKKRLL